MHNFPFISIIIPCRNEVDYIGKVIEDILSQDYPNDKMEILIIDGESDDNTQSVIEEKSKHYPNVIALNNARKIVPTALNIGIKAAKGEIIVRIDAHCEYPKNYVSYLVKNLIDLKADNVGVAMIAHPRNKSLTAKAISEAISSPFGIGDSLHRIGITKPTQIDSVPFGCYKKEVFERIGLFDEELIRNQDDEFNARLRKNGGKIYLLPDIEIKYMARDTIPKISKMFYYYGYFKPLVNKKVGSPATIRQFVPPAYLLMLISTLLLTIFSWNIGWLFFMIVFVPHSFLNLLISSKIALKSKSIKMVPLLFFIFNAIHFSYGSGYIKGVVRFQLLKKRVQIIDLSTNR